MPDENKTTPATDALKALAQFMHEPGIVDLPIQQIRSELQKAGFKVDHVHRTFQRELEMAKGRARLAGARNKRIPLMSRFEQLRAGVARVSDVKSAVRQIFSEVFGTSPLTEMYCREFDKLSEEDARSAIEDATLLDSLEIDDSTSKS
jgi:hypothetical protein